MASDKPLNVRCAEALGCKTEIRENKLYDATAIVCACPGHEHNSPAGDDGRNWILPYGEDTPGGWACTGPLIGRFGLRVGRQSGSYEYGSEEWYAVGPRDIGPDSPNACAAIAEWVAQYVEGGEVKP